MRCNLAGKIEIFLLIYRNSLKYWKIALLMILGQFTILSKNHKIHHFIDFWPFCNLPILGVFYTTLKIYPFWPLFWPLYEKPFRFWPKTESSFWTPPPCRASEKSRFLPKFDPFLTPNSLLQPLLLIKLGPPKTRKYARGVAKWPFLLGKNPEKVAFWPLFIPICPGVVVN